MCVVSNIGDSYRDNFPERWPGIYPYVSQPGSVPYATKEDLDKLKAEIEELRKLLLAAKEFDVATGQPDCEMDEKIEFIKKVADLVGVDLEEVFGSENES